MYASFFGLKHSPFSIAPDPRYLYMSERHREALAHLLYGVQGGGGVVLLTGEIGAGKTTVCRCFLEQVPADCQVAYIFNPQLTVPELLQTVCDEFGIVVPPASASLKTYIDALNAHLLAAHAKGRQCLLIIDEAQHLSAEVLEQLRLLTNLETRERKLLQIVLIGQPELRTLLAGAGLEQLAQRVIARYHLDALTPPETAAYVAHRLAVAGLAGPLPFDAAALRRIHASSGGVPRRINLLCDRALLGAFAEGRPRVGSRIVERAAAEVFDAAAAAARRRRSAPLVLGLAGVLGGAALLGAGWMLGTHDRRPGAGAQAAAASAAPHASAVPVPAAQASEAVATAASFALVAGSASAPVAPAAAASQAAAAAAELPPLLPTPGLAVFPSDEAQAWRTLAPLWGWQPSPATAADPCLQARAQGLRCFRTGAGTLTQLRQLDRPALLLLRDGDGKARHARLVALGPQRATLAADDRAYAVSIDELAQWWRGDFATIWRPPDGYSRLLEPGAEGPAVDALAQGLAQWRREPPPPPGQVLQGALAANLASFQLAQGLKVDGIAGPTTFMLLNRALGVAEPHLAAGSPER
ncbi:MAG: AAA family ATPase [Burkholderiaceae bacterium]|nr:AAA family ATPase [Burkholderiaceae bacterium]